MGIPLVSIGLPIFNSKKKIIRVLFNILNQSYKKVEIIITDNSKDKDTLKIIRKKFKTNKIKYFKNNMNFGLIYNHNKALKKAKGKYFMWIHDVDKISKNYIKECVKILEQDSSKIASMGKIIYIKKNKIQCNYNEPNFDESCLFKRLKKFLLADYPDTIISALFRRNKGKELKKIMSPEGICTLNLVINGKISGISKVRYIKGNDSDRTINQMKENYHGDQLFLNTSIFRRYGNYYYTLNELSKAKIKTYKKFILYAIYIIFNFPILRFFFKKPYNYYNNKN